VSPAEADAVDPHQRLILQTGYTSLHSAGQQRATLMGRELGVLVGISKTDFQQLSIKGKLSAGGFYLGAGSDLGIAPRRLAYALGLQGPALSLHTACSSSLVALDVATRYHGIEEWSVSGVHMVLNPPFWAASTGGIQSLIGRSFVFDARADGFARSEACVSVASLPQDAALTLQASATRQDGKSVSLTAPNGQAQRLMLRTALGSAGIDELVLFEAAANGSPLGDSIEVGALASTLPSTALLGNGKGSIAHTEPSSGHSGLALLGAKLRCAHGSANAQLRLVNPVVDQARQSHLLPMQHVPLLPGRREGGVSAFGYSGTIATAVIQFVSDDRLDHSAPSFVYKQRVVPWRNPVHPFVQRQLSSADSALAFRSVLMGAFLAPVTDHIIQGQTLFPATAYLEMARAAQCAFATSLAGALSGVIFMHPLVGVSDSATYVDCRVANGRFEVVSGEQDSSLTHSAGSVVHPDVAAWRQVDHALLRGQHIGRCLDVKSYYDTMDTGGANFGPGYRRLNQAWLGSLTCVGRLRLRKSRQGTGVHPADLDAGVSMKPTLWIESGLPFSIDDALLTRAALAGDEPDWCGIGCCAAWRTHRPASGTP
jgi:hypothetical protein